MGDREKNFDQWNTVKKDIDAKMIRRDFFFYEREVWWCSVGINVGVESDGKNENFERPILILKKFNGQMIWTIPLTSKPRTGEYYLKITHENGVSWACLSQLKTTSTKRLIRKIGMISEQDFGLVLENTSAYLKKSIPPLGGISEAEATNN